MIPTREEMKKAREYILSQFHYTMDDDVVKTALACIQALISAGDVFLPTKHYPDMYNTQMQMRTTAKRDVFIDGYNTRASEDIAVLAQKLAGLEGVIRGELIPYADAKWRKDKFEFDERIMTIFSKQIALAITQHLKGKAIKNA